MKTICIIGTLDTKGEESALLRDAIERRGFRTLMVDAGVLGEPFFSPDIGSEEVARAGGGNIGGLRVGGDRGEAIRIMGRGVEKVLPELLSAGRIHAVIALGGGCGTSIATSGMRALPFGVPKVMVSTLAGRDVSGYVGIKDIVMVPSVVDISGINRISREVILRAASAVCGMAEVEAEEAAERPTVAATMFGNTTPCVGEGERNCGVTPVRGPRISLYRNERHGNGEPYTVGVYDGGARHHHNRARRRACRRCALDRFEEA